IAAAEAAADAIKAGRASDELEEYDTALKSGPVADDLKPVRNVKPIWSRYGLGASLTLGGFDMWSNTLGFSVFGTMSHGKSDAESTEPADRHTPIDYPKPDGTLSFDRLTNVSFAMTNHEESQPCHLTLKDASVPVSINWPTYAGPSARYCPAGVYEFVTDEGAETPRFLINFQNCVHCKTCDIKDPRQNIVWKTPQGGDGPNYPNM
ncbi:MAG: 4Fe-4S dicluster domain-containing protein, partial [Pseudomonadota bacterium]